MDWWVLELLADAVLIALALWLGPLIKRFGKSYAADVFRANPRTGKSFIVLTDIAYYLCYGPAGTRLRELIRVAGSRWGIEEAFQTAKNEVGLDNYQVRRYDAWYRHVTLCLLAGAYLTAVRDID